MCQGSGIYRTESTVRFLYSSDYEYVRVPVYSHLHKVNRSIARRNRHSKCSSAVFPMRLGAKSTLVIARGQPVTRFSHDQGGSDKVG